MMADRAISGMFGRIANYYDFLNRALSLGIDQYWRKVLADNVRPGPLVLDLAAGTLDVAIKIAARWPQSTVAALDFCAPMLRRGLRKLRGQRILPCAADARALPLADNCASCATIAFGIRNITPRAAAFAEMLRVLEPGGKVLILEFGSGKERIWGGVYNLYLNRLLPLIGRAVSHDREAYGYLARTIREFPSAAKLAQEMNAAGFEKVAWRRLSGGIVCLHWGWKPKSAQQPRQQSG